MRLLRAALSLAALCGTTLADNSTSYLTFSSSLPSSLSGSLLLASPNSPPTLYISSNDQAGAVRAANDLSEDFGRVLGTKATISGSAFSSSSSPAIIIGTIGHSPLIDSLVASNEIDPSSIEGKWESYLTTVISDSSGEPTALVLAGSDVRGTIYAIYDLSEQIGVSPWYWWADVAPKQRDYILAAVETRIHGPPSVKFRGIFLNDEAPALTNWAAGRFPRSQYGNPFNSDFYRLIFELILRLKGNYLWPAMWNSMFYLDDTRSGPLANEYGIFMGTSHHEPCARADKEQGRFLQGAWDWASNRNNIQNFMAEGIRRSKDWFTVYTLGMRGSGDAASATLNSQRLEEVIRFQQSSLTSITGKPLQDVPQAWVMYKEVPGYWQRGMDVNEDVTLLWTDDNRGNIRRIPTQSEIGRRGGSGMYYHFDYVGGPRNYKWINTIQLTKTWEQMHLAYESGNQNIWICNVGDLKALELPTAHFMAMAYDMSKFTTPSSTKEWLTSWSSIQFTPEVASAAADIMSTYGTLTARRKYEDLSITPFAFSSQNYDEAEKNYAEWEALLSLAQATHDSIPAEHQIAFWEMVLHPVMAGKTVYEIYSKAAIGAHYAGQNSLRADSMAQEVRDAFSRDQEITRQYHGLLGGKWNHMMSQTHIGYNNWQEPAQNSLPPLTTVSGGGGGGTGWGWPWGRKRSTKSKRQWPFTWPGFGQPTTPTTPTAPATSQSGAVAGTQMGIGIQGGNSGQSNAAEMTILPMSPYMPPQEQRWIDVFMREAGSLTYEITPQQDFISATNPTGSISTTSGSSRTRSIISIDWASVPPDTATASLQVSSGSQTQTITVPLRNLDPLPESFAGHVAFNGALSFEADSFAEIQPSGDNSSIYVVIPEYGRTKAGAKLWPVTVEEQRAGTGPAMVFPFFVPEAEAGNARITVYLSASENANFEVPNRYAVQVDDGQMITVQPTPISPDAGSEPSGWDNAVTRNAWIRDSDLGNLAQGEHVLKIWLTMPTTVFTKAVIDLGGVQSSEMGPPESFVA